MISKCKRITFVCLTVTLFASVAAAQNSRARMPASDDEVLEILPWQPLFNRNQLSAVRQKLAADPNNEELAIAVARGYIKAGSTAGDPRFYGYARSAIKPWWNKEAPPSGIAAIRAKLKEKNHDYRGAIEDIESLLNQSPRDVQAWIELANLNRVIGRYDESRKACHQLARIADKVQCDVGEIPLLAATGNAAIANERIDSLLLKVKTESPELESWAFGMKAEISRILGDDVAANDFFAKAASKSTGNYAKRAFASFLIDQNRSSEALSLVEDDTSDTGILLLAAIAAKHCGNESIADQWQAELGQRFEEIRLRGGTPHGRFEAQYLLHLCDDPKRSLQVAIENWALQKESRDSRNVLEAALATNDFAAAEPVIQFLNEHKTEDADLRNLVLSLEQR